MRLRQFISVLLMLPGLTAYTSRPNTMVDSFTTKEASSIVKILSKLHPLVLVPPSTFSAWSAPQLCWLDDPRSRVLNQVLLEYEGELSWVVFSDLPRSCLIPALVTVSEGQSHSTQELRDAAVRDVEHLSTFLEQRLSLTHKPSLGVSYSEETLDLPGMIDQRGPGGGVCLVADPVKFSKNMRTPTSRFDRELHFWITAQEMNGLYSLLVEDSPPDIQPSAFPLLTRIANSEYQGLVILPQEMLGLIGEIDKLQRSTPRLGDALDRLRKVAKSAIAYHLGLYVSGD